MSEPLSSDDIEDVVSSVRRLVSPEARPRPVSRDMGQDKLLLTPALRVVSEPIKPEPVAAEPAKHEPVASDPLILNAQADEAVSKPKDKAYDGATPMEVTAPDDPPEAALQVVEGEWEDAFWSEDEPALAEMALGAEEAELVAAEEADLVAAEESLVAAEESAVVAEESMVAAAEAPTVSKSSGLDEAAPWAQRESDWAEDDPVPFVHLRRSVSEVPEPAEATAAKTAPEVEEPQVSEPQPEPEKAAAEGWEDTERTGLAASEMAQILTDQDGNPVTVLDEEGLSQIVRMLIREELQGVLGERITHNVRKLVRAEINRALTAQSLD